MGNVEFTDNRIKVEAALNDAIVAFLYEVAVEVEAQTKIAQTRVDTGHTKGEWTHYVDEDKGEAVIGNPTGTTTEQVQQSIDSSTEVTD